MIIIGRNFCIVLGFRYYGRLSCTGVIVPHLRQNFLKFWNLYMKIIWIFSKLAKKELFCLVQKDLSTYWGFLKNHENLWKILSWLLIQSWNFSWVIYLNFPPLSTFSTFICKLFIFISYFSSTLGGNANLTSAFFLKHIALPHSTQGLAFISCIWHSSNIFQDFSSASRSLRFALESSGSGSSSKSLAHLRFLEAMRANGWKVYNRRPTEKKKA